jgi:PH (Pleckstrin Homology) domain-containing protein
MSDDLSYNSGSMGVSEPQDTPPPEPQPQAAPQPQPDVQPLPAPQPSVPFPLQQNEQVLQLVRRHWWFLWPFTVWLVVVALAPVAVVAWLLDAIGVLDNLNWFFWIPALLWIGYWGVRALFNWYRYQNDIWVVTNQRLIDVFRSNPFNKRVGTADLVNIQDMKVERRGVTATILGYSDLICSTAGTDTGVFNISGVPNAEELQLLIDRERDRERMRRA